MKPGTVPRGVSRPRPSLAGAACGARVPEAVAVSWAEATVPRSSAPSTAHASVNREVLLDIDHPYSALRCRLLLHALGDVPERPPQHDHRALGGAIAARIAERRRGLPGNDVVWRVERRIDPSPPRFAAGQVRQLEIERFPERIGDEVQFDAFAPHLGAEGQAVRLRPPVGPQERDAVPRGLRTTQHVGEADALTLVRLVAQRSPRVEQLAD